MGSRCRALDFDDLPQRIHHVFRRKLSGQDVRTLTKRKRCLKQLKSQTGKFRSTSVLWVEFGTTAHVAADLLHTLGKPYFIAVHGFRHYPGIPRPLVRIGIRRLANSQREWFAPPITPGILCTDRGCSSDRCNVVRLPLDGLDSTCQRSPIADPVRFVHLGRLVEKKGPLQTLSWRFTSAANP